MITRATLVTLLCASTVALGGPKPAPDDLPGPPPEVVKDRAKVEVPPIPPFALPVVEPGFHGPRELRVHGKAVLGTEIRVKGYVTWIYDCAAALAAKNPKATRARILASIDKDPTLCDRPKFFLGDARDTPRDASIWVADVPRPPTRAERARGKPGDPRGAWPEVPRLALGDYVVVTGTWALRSPHDERAAGGLLVYKALEHAAPPAVPAATSPVTSPAEPEVAVVTQAPLHGPIANQARNESMGHLTACTRANAARQFDVAITECQAAVKAWDGNHLAWYTWASAHMARGEWQKARDAASHAVTLRPDLAMYQLYHGISLYEAERERVRGEQAREQNKKPEEVTLDVSRTKLDAARDALRRAQKLDPELWRSHDYLGQVYRDLDDPRRQAEQWSQLIATHPSYRFGYIALIELYRTWDYHDQALAVGRLGLAHVPAAEAGELWYEVGMTHDARHEDDQAIDAFSKAIDGHPDDAGSKFQRGQIYFRRGDFANARRDLEEVARSTDPRIAQVKPLAGQMLSQMAKQPR